jgi:hypothetical protein
MASWNLSAFYSKVADLEKNDPEISKLSDQIRSAVDAGRDTERLNAKFEKAIERKLGR